MTELKACPFCGGEAIELFNDVETAVLMYAIGCMICDGKSSDYLLSQQAIDAWNRRVEK